MSQRKSTLDTFARAGGPGGSGAWERLWSVSRRTSNRPYRWEIGETSLGRVANVEKKLPQKYIAADGFGITPAAKRYLSPLIHGEDYPPYGKDGLPQYVRMKKVLAKKKLPGFDV